MSVITTKDGIKYEGENSGSLDNFNVYTKTESDASYVKLPTVDATQLIDLIYPIGSIYMSVTQTSPASFLGGSWTPLEDTFLLGAGDTYTAGTTGGEATHTLTESEMPEHVGHFYDSPGNMYPGRTDSYYMSKDKAISLGLLSSYNGRHWVITAGNEIGIANVTRGKSQAHNNLPPYTVVYMWKRIEPSTT